MRIISGDLKGRSIKSVPGKTTRPTSDKVKEAVFQMIGPYFNGGTALDLFAGSGAMGIEALSRGMDQCVFIDQSRSAVHTIQTNLQTLNLTGYAEVHRARAQKAIAAMANQHMSFNLIILDPPYKKADYITIIDSIIQSNLLDTNGLIYCEHDPDEALPVSTDTFSTFKQAQYGKTTAVTIYQILNKGEHVHE